MVKNKSRKSVNLYQLDGKISGQITLRGGMFIGKDNPSLVAQAVRVYLSSQRKAHPKVKTRGEVKGSTRKIWRQKGTGRARHGSLTAPIFVGGGVAHGPTGKENWKLIISKKMKRAALASVLSDYLSQERVAAVSDLEKIKPKTKEAEKLLKAISKNEKNFDGGKAIFIVKEINDKMKRAFGNLKGKGILLKQVGDLNTYLVLQNRYLIFDKKTLEIEK